MADKARLTYLAYSGGVQSQVLGEMVLRGDLARPENFIFLTTNPGMENSESRAFVDKMQGRCKEAGIPFIRAQGPNLFEDFTSLRHTKTHLDTPPLWTKDRKTGRMGALLQECTQAYKIEPMRRALRGYIWWKWNYGMTRKTGLPPVDGWIGFAADESGRIKPRKKRDPKFITLRYPLIELGMGAAYFTCRRAQKGLTVLQ